VGLGEDGNRFFDDEPIEKPLRQLSPARQPWDWLPGGKKSRGVMLRKGLEAVTAILV
jgi:hypothetical protein